VVELELGQLDCKYAGLRVAAPAVALLASLSEFGQQTPVLVVGGADNGTGAVLVDGYRRKAALHTLKRDTVLAVRLDIGEAEALVMRHQLVTGQRPSALEDGWLLQSLLHDHALTRRELGERLQRSAAWVSGRLGLVRELPEALQEAVRRGRVPAYSAARELLAFTRVNSSRPTRCGSRFPFATSAM